MLQRQIMFKQLQELQRRQQLQELGDPRNQDYMNQLSSLKQASGVQFPSTINGTPVNDSQMLMLGNMQMMQHGGSTVFQGLPNGVGFSQSHNHGVGLSQPQYDLYGTPNTDKNLNQYSHLQGPSNHSGNLLGKNNNSPLRMSPVHPSAFASSFSMPDGSLLPGQVFQEKNLFGQVPAESFNSDILSHSYSEQGMVQPDASLDPLEQKILYNTDDNSWESSFSRNSKMGSGGFDSTVENPSFLDSIQSGSWSALMQSAVAETSSSDTGIQEEWSGLSFQNPEPSMDNQPSNFIINNEKPQNNWVDRNSQHVSSPSSKPEHLVHNSNMNCNFPGFQSEPSRDSRQQSPRNTSQLTDYNSQQKHPTGGSHLVQTSLSTSNTWPGQYKGHLEDDNRFHNNFSGHEVRGNLWLHGSTSNPVAGGIQKPFDQGNQLNIHRYSTESGRMAPGNNVERMPSLLSASSDIHGQNVTSQSESMLELLNKDDISDQHTPGMQSNSTLNELSLTETSVASFAKPCKTPPTSQGFGFRVGPADPRTPQPYSFFPSLSMENSNASPLPSHDVNNYIKNHHPAPPVPTTKFPVYSATTSQVQHVGSTQWPDITTQQDVSSPKPFKFSSNLFRSHDSASSSLETSSGAPNEQLNQNSFKNEHNVQGFGAYSGASEKESSFHDGSLVTHTHQQPSNQTDQRYNESPAVPARDMRAFSHSLNQNQSMHQVQSPRNAENHGGKRSPLKYDSVNYQQAIANARELFLSGQKAVTNDKAKGDLDAVAHISNEASNVTYQSQISMQMAPSWFKHYETLKNGQGLPIYDPRTAVNAAQTFSGITIGNLQENSLIRYGNSANANQGSGVWPSSTATLIESKNLSSPSMLPSDTNYQTWAVSIPKKRKIVAFEMVPWHKEVNHEPLRLQHMSIAELEWVLASNRRQEEVRQVKNETETVEDVLPVVRAKRRLTFTTQLMQQVFRPPPAVILFADASTNCDYVAYSASRLALGDACNLTHKPPSDTNNVSPDKLKTLRRISDCDFSKVVEGLISRVKKLEGDLSRLDRTLSIVDIKVEAQDLEKFSTINRFAKFHIKSQSNTIDPTSSSGPSTAPKILPQKYVTGVPMPKIVPEGTDCLSL
ncbi:hypothetical protein BUALT_Bualt04G0137300 [Buddleja alternifolia]|uniref:Uncharacterized protein n=1 Tax=Buddleja alternifolia TaxID=168488 RepID=A0AAV6XQ30_9LAMI|nr:hypothetical protein BUALT_Bualt04G0137300 [Buddleja alternifolia]